MTIVTSPGRVSMHFSVLIWSRNRSKASLNKEICYVLDSTFYTYKLSLDNVDTAVISNSAIEITLTNADWKKLGGGGGQGGGEPC